MNNKKVVICVAVYNSESTLRATLESLCLQSYPLFKIKILDNASTDSTRKIAEEFSAQYPFIEIITHPINIGGEGNFSACLKASDGDYTLIAHADDVYDPHFIKKSVETLEHYPNAVASFVKAHEIDSAGKITGTRLFPDELCNGETTIIDLTAFFKLVSLYGNVITCPSVVCRSEIYRDKIINWNGGEFNTSADLDVWFRLLEYGSIVAINNPLINYRVADASYSFRIAKKRVTRHDFFKVTDFYQSKYKTLINQEISENFIFLELKDHAIRSLNILRSKELKLSYPNDVKFQLGIIFKKMFHSFWHLKMGLSILGIALLTFLKRAPREVSK